MGLFVRGEPATFATALEKDWRQRLTSTIPLCQRRNEHSGITLRFILSSPNRRGQNFDIDNLIEPVFSVLIGEKGYFSGKRTNLRWWYARKEIGTPAGVKIELYEGNPSISLKGKEIFNGEYRGELPKSATSEGLPNWLITQGFRERRHDRFGIHFIFPENINIGAIATGIVKSTIDCLWPIIGGKPRDPEDWRVEELVVEKKLGYTGLRLKIQGN